MGSTNFSSTDYDSRLKVRAATATPVMKHTADVVHGRVAAKVHDSLNPYGVKLRESRDSDAHPETVPMAIILDVTGSMSDVPEIIEAKLVTLMGHFLEDKASGKKYLGEGYPAVLIGAVDDYTVVGKNSLQMGQFESGMEIDQMLENLWLTKNGGGTYEESYDLGLYFMGRHTAHDHMDKRGRKGYIFMIGDEKAYPVTRADAVKEVIGDTIQNMEFEQVLAAARELYHVFFIIPNMTSHYGDPALEKFWVKHLGQQNVLKLEDPTKICELIAASVAICEERASVADIIKDGVMTASAAEGMLQRIADARPAPRDAASAAALPAISGKGKIERL